MITRVLPPSDWHLLEGTEAETLWPHLDPNRAEVIVVEHEGEIVGSWVLMNVLHAECLWIAPSHRGKSAVGRRLLQAMLRAAKGVGAPAVLTASLSQEVNQLLEHIGAVRVPGHHYSMRIH